MSLQTSSRPKLRTLLSRAWQFNPPLMVASLTFLALVPVMILAIFIDPVEITGVNGWIKPFKFHTSTFFYTATLLWLLTYVRERPRLVRVVSYGAAATLTIENVLITTQVLRRTSSHYNVNTSFDAAVFSAMGTAITILAFLHLAVLLALLFQRMDDRVFAWALRLGLLCSLIGMMTGFLMAGGPTPEQLAALEAGAPMTTIGAHSIGVADGGPGLPLVGWSTHGGDLRIGHFVGLHGMQIIPLLGWLLIRPNTRRRFSERQRFTLLWDGALLYIATMLILIWQALRGQSVIAPDLVTSTVTACVYISALVVALTVSLRRDSYPQMAQPTQS